MTKKTTIFTILFIFVLTITAFCSMTMYNNNMNYNMGMTNLMYSGLMSILQAYAFGRRRRQRA